MKFYSTNNIHITVDLQEAVIKGLAADKGLYMPAIIPSLPSDFIHSMADLTFNEIGYKVIGSLLADDLSDEQIKDLVDHTLHFDAPLVEVGRGIYALELFHGPTLAFKDFGARFCSKLMSFLLQEKNVKVLVATSGDTGSAVANGFYNVKGVEVVILYPKGKVSSLQEKQFTTLGGNITALEVEGNFDDCQRLVKEAFADRELNDQMLLTSANSINIARWIPQCLYYFYAYSRLPDKNRAIVFSVPSGNFGNLAAGILAERMGLPVSFFVAATNLNKIVPDYLGGFPYSAMPSVQTISNSMDVGNPSNFPRLLALYSQDEVLLRDSVKGYFYDDETTKDVMKKVKENFGYILDPHGAVAYLGLKDFLNDKIGYAGIFLETAHPGKFKETVEKSIGENIVLPERLSAFMKGEKKVISIDNSYMAFRNWLTNLL
ncbi:threonine synthase [Anditalea andensis]|uniref:Threonine synthase n=1 Tax=Anditalea andensis TaxID=1048983 RepID=A0A074L561_9BACT|nr:threonine synthase [Anditalea andensis]KEO74978.1 threonine synthase [Anditalea andensis]